MKRSLIFLLAAGPLFVFGQRLELPPTLTPFQFSAPGLERSPWPGRSGDTAFFQRGLTGGPVRLRSGFPVRQPSASAGFAERAAFSAGFTVREMPPDRMPCLVPLPMPEQMSMSMRGNADPLPNAVNKP